MIFGLSRFGIQLAAVIGGAGLLVTSCVVRDRNIAERQTAKIEKATNNATRLGSGAARKSVDQRVRGVIDPTTRDN